MILLSTRLKKAGSSRALRQATVLNNRAEFTIGGKIDMPEEVRSWQGPLPSITYIRHAVLRNGRQVCQY